MFPLLYVLSVFFGLIGGLIVGPAVGAVSVADYLNGIQNFFNPYYVTFSLIKCLVFGFLISSISAYFGYTVEGGAFDVGTASTRAVVNTNIQILVWDLILTQILL
jgi:phospholipid/cholesterol/gamma-HCH transport system permease protein